jgi:uncharacterized protein (DUF4415 family)
MAIVRMTSEEIKKKYPLTPERLSKMRAIKDEDIDFSDLPEATDEQLAYAVRGRPKKNIHKENISIRLSPDNLKALQKIKGWQTRIDELISEWIKNGLL